MAYDFANDPRLDPRIKAILVHVPPFEGADVDSREALIAEANSEEALKAAEIFRSFMDLCDTEEAAPSAGLRIHSEKVVSAPDGNTINLQIIRPDTEDTLACVYYIHGGGMESLSCYDGMYRGLGQAHRRKRRRRGHGRLPQCRAFRRPCPRLSRFPPASTTASPA